MMNNSTDKLKQEIMNWFNPKTVKVGNIICKEHILHIKGGIYNSVASKAIAELINEGLLEETTRAIGMCWALTVRGSEFIKSKQH